jgi:peptidoglycan/xylan/chitin deacetylase (PgdA/CDA1 family)
MGGKETMKRDLIGYGTTPPKVGWPNGACLAVSLVVNYEEGAEFGADQGDPINERIAELHSPVGNGVRDLGREQMFNYGLRAGLWRILDALDRHRRKATFYMCARAVERTPGLAAEVVRRGHEPALHSYRWANHVLFTDEEAERNLIERSAEVIRSATAERPQGFYARWAQGPNTRRLLQEEGGFVYDSNSYDDDLPFYDYDLPRGPMLVIPYALDTNDVKYFHPNGFALPEDFFSYTKAAIDTLIAEGERGRSKLLNVGLHLRITGRPARLRGLEMLLSYLDELGDKVWVARRLDIAKHWLTTNPP